MPVGAELERLVRTIDEVVAGVEDDLEAEDVTEEDIRSLRTAIETCMMKLNDLRTRLAGSDAG